MRTRILGGITALIIAVAGYAHVASAIGPIVRIEIAPPSPTVTAGASQPFTVKGFDAAGASADLTANATFVTTDPLGSMKANAYMAGKTGDWVITANYNTLSIETKTAVTPGTLKEIIINPNSSPEYITSGASRSFSAEGFDAFNNAIASPTTQWAVEGKIGTVTMLTGTAVKFTATAAGTGRLVAKSGDVAAIADITVEKPAPAPVNLNLNANTPINTNKNTANVNNSSNADTTANVNATNENVNTAPVATTTETPTVCKGWSRAAWVWVYLIYLALLIAVLYPIRKSRVTWWFVGPLLLTIAALWIYFQFRCYPVFPALPYLILLSGIAGASWYNWQRNTPPTM